MKKTVFCLMFLVLPSLVFAGTWCQWSGTEGENCKTTTQTSVVINDVRVTVSAENLNPRGWYELTRTEPTIGEDQVKDAEVWGFADNAISLTWTVRDLTATELDERIASPMSVTDYYQWKAFIASGLFTTQQLQTYFQANDPDMITAYQARARLIGD